jgi:hypothetical protein
MVKLLHIEEESWTKHHNRDAKEFNANLFIDETGSTIYNAIHGSLKTPKGTFHAGSFIAPKLIDIKEWVFANIKKPSPSSKQRETTTTTTVEYNSLGLPLSSSFQMNDNGSANTKEETTVSSEFIKFELVNGQNIAHIHLMSEDYDIIQVSSLFNGLQMENFTTSHYDGIEIYRNQESHQGALAALACLPGICARNYNLPIDNQKFNRFMSTSGQFNALVDLDLTPENGYLLWGEKPTKVIDKFVKYDISSNLRIPCMMGTEVTGCMITKKKTYFHQTNKLVHQILSATVPINQYGNSGKIEDQETILRMVLKASYEGVIGMGLILHHYDRIFKRVTSNFPTINLTLLGMNPFPMLNNKPQIVVECIKEALDTFKGYAMHVKLHMNAKHTQEMPFDKLEPYFTFDMFSSMLKCELSSKSSWQPPKDYFITRSVMKHRTRAQKFAFDFYSHDKTPSTLFNHLWEPLLPNRSFIDFLFHYNKTIPNFQFCYYPTTAVKSGYNVKVREEIPNWNDDDEDEDGVERIRSKRRITFYDSSDKTFKTTIFIRHRDDFIKQLKYEQNKDYNCELKLLFDPKTYIIKEDPFNDINRVFEYIMSYIFTHELIPDEKYDDSDSDSSIHEFQIKNTIFDAPIESNNNIDRQTYKLMFFPRKAIYGIKLYPVLRIGSKITLLVFTMASTVECNHFLTSDKHDKLRTVLTNHVYTMLQKNGLKVTIDQTLLPILPSKLKTTSSEDHSSSSLCVVCLSKSRCKDSHGNFFCSEDHYKYFHT